MGPCRIVPDSKARARGVCGATAATVVARHLIRQVAAGTAAHSDHGHDIAKALLDTALKKVNHMDITLCKFKINKATLYKLIKIEPYLLTLETYN